MPCRAFVVLVVGVVALWTAASAHAEVTHVFGGDVTCTMRDDGVRACGEAEPRATTPSFDGVPLDVNVGLPATSTSGSGPYPLIVSVSGWSNAKVPLSSVSSWLARGFAVMSMTPRGFRESCGSAAARAAAPDGCASGYGHMADDRYEVRDVQFLAGELADEGLVEPTRIGVVGSSYGGGIAMSLAALRDRTMLPDGTVVPWVSPTGHIPMRIAFAAPTTTWSDLANAVAPAGRNLDYVDDAVAPALVGVEQESLVDALAASCSGGIVFCAPAALDPAANPAAWKSTLENAPPDVTDVAALMRELRLHHSAYGIDHSEAPAPMLLSQGFTDDWMPARQALRLYTRTRDQFPGARMMLLFGDFGHRRGSNPRWAGAIRTQLLLRWARHYLQDVGPVPPDGVEALPQTCDAGDEAPAPITGADWAAVGRGEIRLTSPLAQTIGATGGDPALGVAFGSSDCARVSAADQPEVATYRFAPAPAGGFTLLGSPTVITHLSSTGANPQIAARLLDAAPDGEETLVARGLWRPDGSAPEDQVFQLNANAWHFEEGHVAKLELLPADPPYGSVPGDQPEVTVHDIDVRLPVVERAGALHGYVTDPAPKVVPSGARLASDFARPHWDVRVVREGAGEGTVSGDPLGLDCGATCSASFEQGVGVTLQATAAHGSLFAGWSGGGCSGTAACRIDPTADVEVHALFAKAQRHLTVVTAGQGNVRSAPAGVDCEPRCAMNVDDGTLVTLTATPATGWRFDHWVGGSCSATPVCSVPMDADHSIGAAFVRTVRTLTVTTAGPGAGHVTSAPSGVMCPSGCSHDFPAGTMLELTARADAHSAFAGWTGGGCSGTGSCRVTLGTDTVVRATFVRARRRVSVVTAGDGGVTSAPLGIWCGPYCSASFDDGTPVVLTARASAGSSFTGWSGVCDGTATTCRIDPARDVTVHATFRKLRRRLTVAVAGQGLVRSRPSGIKCRTECSTNFDDATSVVLSAVPAAGWHLASWSEPGCRRSPECTLHLRADRRVSAVFAHTDVPAPPSVRPHLESSLVRLVGALRRLGVRALSRRHGFVSSIAGSGRGTTVERVTLRTRGPDPTLAKGALVSHDTGPHHIGLRLRGATQKRLRRLVARGPRRIHLAVHVTFVDPAGASSSRGGQVRLHAPDRGPHRRAPHRKDARRSVG